MDFENLESELLAWCEEALPGLFKGRKDSEEFGEDGFVYTEELRLGIALGGIADGFASVVLEDVACFGDRMEGVWDVEVGVERGGIC